MLLVFKHRVGTAAVVNTANIFDEVSNSAEVEQEAEQENECALAVCANAIGLQTQVGTAAVVNTANIFVDASHDGVINSAEVEQEAEQENECATFNLCQCYWSSDTDRNCCCSKYC